MGYLAHIIGAKPSEMEKWFELKVIFFDMIFAFCRSAAFVEAQASHSTVIPCGIGERPRAIAFIYRDRLIWVCRFRQRRLNCTQGNSSCKTSYEYMALA